MRDANPAILLCGHGSRSPEARTDFYHLVEKIKQQRPGHTVTAAFLQFDAPTIGDALQDIHDRGTREVIIQPVMLYQADHITRDIPAILTRFQHNHPEMTLHYGSALGLTPPVIEAAARMVTPFMMTGRDCELLVVGRGSPDRNVSDQTINLCQKLRRRLAVAQVRYCYGHHSAPSLTTALKQATRSHYRRIIILPFLLFPGRLLAEIYHEIDRVAAKYPTVIFDKAPPLGPQDFIADAVLHRLNILNKSGQVSG